MKRIIKRGKLPKEKDLIKRFKCLHCGCIFDCTDEDWVYEQDPYFPDTKLAPISHCPECHNKTNKVISNN